MAKRIPKSQRPPLGLMPRKIHQDNRFRDVADAINRYCNTGLKIPVKWVKEYNDLIKIKR